MDVSGNAPYPQQLLLSSNKNLAVYTAPQYLFNSCTSEYRKAVKELKKIEQTVVGVIPLTHGVESSLD